MFFRLFERLLVLLLILSSMNFVSALKPSSREQTEAKTLSADVNTFSVAIECSVYAYGGIFVFMRWRRVLRAARMAWPVLVLAALACLSTTWSVQLAVTLRRSALLLAATILAFYLGERYSIEAFARITAQSLCVMMVLVLVFYLVAPEYVVSHSAYGSAWKGLSGDKNTFGEHMAVAIPLLMLVRFRRFQWVRYLFLVIAASLLLLSGSATAVLCGVLSIAAILLWRLTRGEKRSLAYPLVALMFLLGISCVLAFPEPFFRVLGRDATLTGRTRLWAMLLPVMAARPILGYGFGAFWVGLKAEVLGVWIGEGHLIRAADSGYIDLFLSLGAVGVALFLYVFFITFRRSIEYVKTEPGLIGLWPVTFLCIFAADNVCESALLTRGTFSFLVFAILATSLALNHKHLVAPPRTADNQLFMWESTPPVLSR